MTDETKLTRSEIGRRWREKHPDYFRDRAARMTDEEREAERAQRHEQYVRRRDADPERMRTLGRESARRQREARGDEIRDYHRARYAADPETHRRASRDWAKNHPEHQRDKAYRRYYGITLAEYERLHDEQHGLCALCGRPETVTLRGKLKALSVDHDHATGRVRGLLCVTCNRALGFLQDDPDLMERAARYVRESRHVG